MATSTKPKRRSRKKAGESGKAPKAPKKQAKAKSQKEVDAERIPVSDDVVTAPPIDPYPPMPTGFEPDDRVVIPDMGSRHGTIEQVDEDGKLLLVKLDGAIVHPEDPTKKVRRIEIETSRCRVCRGDRE